MRARPLRVPLLLLTGLAAGCGGHSPSAPSTVTPPNVSLAAAQGVVGATLAQATNSVVTAAPNGLSTTYTSACPGGGSMTSTSNFTTPTGPSSTMTSSSRLEFSDCRSSTVTMNGDPYISMDSEFVFVRRADGVITSMTGTMRMTGGVRYDVGGTQGRSRYDCTTVMSMQLDNGTVSPPSFTSTGTITWEQPIGTVSVRPCGP